MRSNKHQYPIVYSWSYAAWLSFDDYLDPIWLYRQSWLPAQEEWQSSWSWAIYAVRGFLVD